MLKNTNYRNENFGFVFFFCELEHLVAEIHGTTKCKEILQKWVTEAEVEERKHHKIICRQVVGDIAGLVYDTINQD